MIPSVDFWDAVTRAYHFVGKTLHDGTAIPPDGVWLELPAGVIRLCSRGFHASLHVADAVKYAPGSTLCLVELGGTILHGDDKLCASKRRIIARFDATELLRAEARACALSALETWDAPPVVRQYARAVIAATVGYGEAAAASVITAAQYAYRTAVAREVHRDRLQHAVDEKFKLLVT